MGLAGQSDVHDKGYNVSDGVIIPGDEIIKDRVEDVAVESKYIDIPVVAKFYPGLGVHLDAGMQVGFLVGRTLKYGKSRQPSSLLGEMSGLCSGEDGNPAVG